MATPVSTQQQEGDPWPGQTKAQPVAAGLPFDNLRFPFWPNALGSSDQALLPAAARLVTEESGAVSTPTTLVFPGPFAQPVEFQRTLPSVPVAPPQPQVPDPMRQIITAMEHSGGLETEIVLDPPELGRVRIYLRTDQDRAFVQLVAERSETLDLLRRSHPDLLADLQQEGFARSKFTFARARADPEPEEDVHLDLSISKVPLLPLRSLASEGSLDLRI